MKSIWRSLNIILMRKHWILKRSSQIRLCDKYSGKQDKTQTARSSLPTNCSSSLSFRKSWTFYKFSRFFSVCLGDDVEHAKKNNQLSGPRQTTECKACISLHKCYLAHIWDRLGGSHAAFWPVLHNPHPPPPPVGFVSWLPGTEPDSWVQISHSSSISISRRWVEECSRNCSSD